jgi:outer membrane lipoprotein-sorting protein
MCIHPRIRAVILLFAVLPLTGCFFRTHNPEKRLSTAILKEATLNELVETINSSASRLQTLNTTIDIDTAVGGPKKGKVTEYEEIGGYLLIRKPDMLRMIGKFPVVGNRVFDMVSNGKNFELSIPPQNKFIVGTNQIGRPSDKPVENLRPQHILDALLLRPIDQSEIAVLEQSTETVKDPKTHKDAEQADYVVIVIRKEGNGYFLSRKIVFSRVDLMPHEQLIYDKQGALVTDAHYESFTDFGGGIILPTIVKIERPIEEYEIQLAILKPRLNEPIKDEQFVLPQPPGSQLIDMDRKNGATAENQQSNQERPKPNW